MQHLARAARPAHDSIVIGLRHAHEQARALGEPRSDDALSLGDPRWHLGAADRRGLAIAPRERLLDVSSVGIAGLADHAVTLQRGHARS